MSYNTKQTPYRNENEMNYFGSDLNKFINVHCSKEMTTINIDCLQYKRKLHIVRFIESKHSREPMPRSQYEVLKINARSHKFINDSSTMIDKFEDYIIRGDNPYYTGFITNLITEEKFIWRYQTQFIRFLEFDMTFNEFIRETTEV